MNQLDEYGHIPYKVYVKYVKRVFDEEFQRIEEFIDNMNDPNGDWGFGGDKPYLAFPEWLPDIEVVTQVVKDRDWAADIQALDYELGEDAWERVYSELRQQFM